MFHLPIKLLILIVIISIAIWNRIAIKSWYTSLPSKVAKLSLVMIMIGVVSIEFLLRSSGAAPYFTICTGHESGISNIIPLDSLIDYKVYYCDSFGVNKLSVNTSFHQESILNKDGFRSLYNFTQGAIDSIQKSGKKAIFLIGDSYTYGLSADSGHCFASLLDNTSNYAVFNAGIPGTDIPQYKAVINEYILHNNLRPDKVVICITGNDLDRTCNRKLTPGVPILFYTNVGGIYAFQEEDDTTFNNPKSAYLNILNKYTVIGLFGEGWISDFISKSVLACRVLGEFRKVDSRSSKMKVDPAFKDIQEIKSICEQVSLPVIIVYLPGSEFAQTQNAPNIPGVTTLNPMLFSKEDFTPNMDNHPLNSGHQKIALQLLKILNN